MKIDEIRGLTEDEIEDRLHELREEMFDIQLKKRTGETQNPLRERTLRREIARVLTIKNEKRRKENEKKTHRKGSK
jgi:large subunit ribosomal protein L29